MKTTNMIITQSVLVMKIGMRMEQGDKLDNAYSTVSLFVTPVITVNLN